MSRITKSDLGSQANAAALDTAEGGRFSRAIRLSIPTGGQANRATVAPGTVLNTLFQTRDVDGLASGAPEPASLSTSGGNLVLSLPVARQVRFVRLGNPIDGDRISAFRFDGQAVSEDPVKTATHGVNGARLDVTDSQLILKRKNGAEFSLGTGAIDAVVLRYSPVNPRVALRLPGEIGSGTPLPAQTDPDGVPVFPADGTLGADLSAALAAVLAGQSSPLPDPFEVDLILSADQPCLARIDGLDLSLVLETQALPEKTILRFSGGRRDTQSLTLGLPSGALLSGGTLSVSVTGTPPGQRVQNAPLDPLPPVSGEGLRVDGTRALATLFSLGSAQAIAGAEVSLAAPEGPADVRAVLYADRNGQPGVALAESELRTITRARPTSTAFEFAPTAVPAGPVWLGLTAVSGIAVAMLGGSGKIARVDGPAFVIVEDTANRGIAAALRPVAPSGDSISVGGPSLSVGATALPGLPSAGSTQIDLAAVVPGLSVSPTLTVSSAARAVVTIDPPLLQYGLP